MNLDAVNLIKFTDEQSRSKCLVFIFSEMIRFHVNVLMNWSTSWLSPCPFKLSLSIYNGNHCSICPSKEKTYLHNIKEHLLTQTVLLLKELVLGVGTGNVPADEFFTGRGHLQQLRVLLLNG